MNKRSGSSQLKAETQARYAQLFSVDHRQESLVGTIATWVGQEILLGSIPVGADLNSVELAKRFKTSRTPVREALMLLEKEGLVEIPPRRRPKVAAISKDEVRDIYLIRATLLSLAAELLATNGTDEQLATLREAEQVMERADASGDLDVIFWATVKFEDTVVELCGNKALRPTLAPLRTRTLRVWRAIMQEGAREKRLMSDIRHMVEAICRRDGRLAAELYRSLILRNLSIVETVVIAAPEGRANIAPVRLKPRKRT